MVSNRDMYYVGDSGNNPFGDITLNKKFKTKPMSGSNTELPKFEITGSWKADGKWKNDKIGFKIRRKPKTEIKKPKPLCFPLKSFECQEFTFCPNNVISFIPLSTISIASLTISFIGLEYSEPLV